MHNITDTWPIAIVATREVKSNRSSNMTDDFACYLTNDPQVILSYQIYLVATILFVAAGLIGNTLSFIVFSSRAMLRYSSNVYLLILAVSDSFFLVSVFLSKVLTTLRCLYFADSSFDVVNRNSVICKLLQYCNDLFSDYSTCLILGFTVERYAAAYLPIAFKRSCTNRRARIVCAVTFLFISFCIAPYHALFMGRHIEYNICIVLTNHEEEFAVLYIVEVVLFRIIPVITIAVLNVFIIAKVSRINRQRIRIASRVWRGAKCSDANATRLSGRRRAQTSGKPSREDGTVFADGIQSSAATEVNQKGFCLTDSVNHAQIEIRSLGRIKVTEPNRILLGYNRMISCQSGNSIPDKIDHLDMQETDPRQSENSEANQLTKIRSSQSDQFIPLSKITEVKQTDSVQPEQTPGNCNSSELERAGTNHLEFTKSSESSQPEPDETENNCLSSQPERVEPNISESPASAQSNENRKICPESAKFSRPDTEFTEQERLASEFIQPGKLCAELIQPDRVKATKQQALELMELTTNSTNGRCELCTRHVTGSQSRRAGKNANGRKSSGRKESVIVGADGKHQERRKQEGGRRREVHRDDRSLQMTLTLILVSTIHVIVFLPVLVHFVVWKLERSGVIPESPTAMQIAQNHTRVLYIAGFAVNFFLYTVSGRMFREQLRAVLWRSRQSSARSGS